MPEIISVVMPIGTFAKIDRLAAACRPPSTRSAVARAWLVAGLKRAEKAAKRSK